MLKHYKVLRHDYSCKSISPRLQTAMLYPAYHVNDDNTLYRNCQKNLQPALLFNHSRVLISSTKYNNYRPLLPTIFLFEIFKVIICINNII